MAGTKKIIANTRNVKTLLKRQELLGLRRMTYDKIRNGQKITSYLDLLPKEVRGLIIGEKIEMEARENFKKVIASIEGDEVHLHKLPVRKGIYWVDKVKKKGDSIYANEYHHLCDNLYRGVKTCAINRMIIAHNNDPIVCDAGVYEARELHPYCTQKAIIYYKCEHHTYDQSYDASEVTSPKYLDGKICYNCYRALSGKKRLPYKREEWKEAALFHHYMEKFRK